MKNFLPRGLTVNGAGHLCIGGLDTIELAEQYGTPAYIMNEAEIRRNCRIYREAVRSCYGEDSMPMFASKALSCKYIYRILAEEGLGADLVSQGEMYTACAAGFPMERACFHGNNKTDDDLRFAIKAGVGNIVVDHFDELRTLSVLAVAAGVTQKILLRITPGIDPHTHRAISTGAVDSKFGTAIATGQAMEIVREAISLPGIELMGLHCHIGSQIFEVEPFYDAAGIMIEFIADIYRETGFIIRQLNLGGGFGVPYTADQEAFDYAKAIADIAAHVKDLSAQRGIPLPVVFLEPGRSIVASAGITLYTVGSVKEIPGFKNYISVDGGMPDNPRYALYGSRYEMVNAGHADADKTYRCTVAGRCCESGDLLGEDIHIQPCRRGDILAVLVTGAYNYSMASNYNRIPRPPIIMVKDQKAFPVVRRETYEDLIGCDL